MHAHSLEDSVSSRYFTMFQIGRDCPTFLGSGGDPSLDMQNLARYVDAVDVVGEVTEYCLLLLPLTLRLLCRDLRESLSTLAKKCRSRTPQVPTVGYRDQGCNDRTPSTIWHLPLSRHAASVFDAATFLGSSQAVSSTERHLALRSS
jgi:hypothetical protein